MTYVTIRFEYSTHWVFLSEEQLIHIHTINYVQFLSSFYGDFTTKNWLKGSRRMNLTDRE